MTTSNATIKPFLEDYPPTIRFPNGGEMVLGHAKSLFYPETETKTRDKGCICPPGANLTCENPLCPRKNVNKPQLLQEMK